MLALCIRFGEALISPILNPACIVFIKLFIFSIRLLGNPFTAVWPYILYELINSSPKMRCYVSPPVPNLWRASSFDERTDSLWLKGARWSVRPGLFNPLAAIYSDFWTAWSLLTLIWGVSGEKSSGSSCRYSWLFASLLLRIIFCFEVGALASWKTPLWFITVGVAPPALHIVLIGIWLPPWFYLCECWFMQPSIISRYWMAKLGSLSLKEVCLCGSMMAGGA